MRRSLFILPLLLFAVIYGNSQVAGSILRGYAFLRTTTPGVQMVDMDGKPQPPKVMIDRFVYVEVKGKAMPAIDGVMYGRDRFKVVLTAVSGPTETIGEGMVSNKPVILKAAAGNTLWKVQLIGNGDCKAMKDAALYKQIVVQQTRNRKHLSFIIDREVQLASPITM